MKKIIDSSRFHGVAYAFFSIISLIFFAFAANAQESNVFKSDITTVSLQSDVSAIRSGEAFWLGLNVKMQSGWHVYTDPPGDAGLPPQLTWTLPEGFSAETIKWPPHETIKEGEFTTYGYRGEVIYPIRVTPPQTIADGEKYNISVKATWLVCKDICIPENAEFALTLNGTDAATATASSFFSAIHAFVGDDATAHNVNGMGFAVALLLAFLGGVILNLMPCVFPILTLKCLALVRQKNQSRKHAQSEGLAYTAGILVCFAGISALLILLQQGGSAIGWGYQMQSPVFILLLALLMFVIGLNLSGAFTLPVMFGNVNVQGSFFTGLLATLVATPCTAPFMAPAIGFALTQPPVFAFLIFQALGLGLALPFLLISFFPTLSHLLPKPGPWMERFKHLLALPMYASCVWLVWVLAQQSGFDGAVASLLAMLAISLVLWLSPKRNARMLLLAIILIGSVGYVQELPQAQTHSLAEEGDMPFDKDELAELRANGTPVFVDATAAWCITCRVNHFSTMRNERVKEAFKEKGVVLMIADWTNRDEEITTFLASHGFSGVPLYVYYPPHEEGKVLPQLLTPALVLDALQ